MSRTLVRLSGLHTTRAGFDKPGRSGGEDGKQNFSSGRADVANDSELFS